MTTEPRGFWEASVPVVTPDDATFAQHNMNWLIIQKGNDAFLIDVLRKHGVSGYNDVLGIFRRLNGSGVIEDMPTIIVGNVADRPDAVVANNGAWYYAIDTAELSVIHNGVRLVIGSTGFDLHDDVTIEMITISGSDRLVVSDESSPGDPNEWLSLNRLLDWIEDMISISADAVTNGRFSFNRMPQNVIRMYVTTGDTRPSAVQEGDFWAIREI